MIAAAREVFAERGFDAASVDDVARRAGVSKGAVYHHYKDKTELLAAAYEDLERELTDRLASLAGQHEDPIDALRAGCQGFIDACAEPAVRRLALQDAPSGLGWARWREIDAQFGFGLLLFGLRAAAESGQVRPERLETRAHFLLAVLMEGALIIASASDPAEASRDVAALVDDYIASCRS